MVRDADGHWRLQKAERFMAAAERALAFGDYETAISRGYYAAYHSVIALLKVRARMVQRVRWDHSQVEIQLREHFTNRGYLLARQQADDLRELLNARLVADYEQSQISRRRVEQYLKTASSLVEAVKRVV